jgi:hypothetical protein
LRSFVTESGAVPRFGVLVGCEEKKKVASIGMGLEPSESRGSALRNRLLAARRNSQECRVRRTHSEKGRAAREEPDCLSYILSAVTERTNRF